MREKEGGNMGQIRKGSGLGGGSERFQETTKPTLYQSEGGEWLVHPHDYERGRLIRGGASCCEGGDH